MGWDGGEAERLNPPVQGCATLSECTGIYQLVRVGKKAVWGALGAAHVW